MKGLLFTYLLTYGGAATALATPYVGFLIYVCFAIIKPEALWHWSVPEGNYSRIIAIGLLLGWALNGFGNWQLGRGRAIIVAIVGYWLWSVICALRAPNAPVAWEFVETLTKIVLPLVVGITTLDSISKLKQLAWVIVLSQGYVAFELNLSYFGGFNRARIIGFAGMEEGSLSIGMVTCAGMALFLALDATKLWQKMLGFSLTVLLVHVPMISFSRGGMLGLIVTGLVAFLLIPKQPKHYLALIAVILVGVRLAGPEVRERLMTSFASTSDRDVSAQSRLDLWANCWDAMLRHPLLGLGPNHFPLVVHEYGWKSGKEAHTLWLQIGAELGFLGLLLLASFYVLCVKRLWPLTDVRSPVADPWMHSASRMVIASLCGFAFSAQFISLEGLEVPYYIALLGAGILKLNSVGSPRQAAGDRRSPVLGASRAPCEAVSQACVRC